MFCVDAISKMRKKLECVAISSSMGSSWPRDRTYVSCISCIGRQILYHWTTWETLHQCKLWTSLIMVCYCSLTNYKNVPLWYRMLTVGENVYSWGRRSTWKLSVLFSQFCCESKTALQNKVSLQVVKNPPASVGHKRCRFHPWVGKMPWSRKWQPTPVFLLGNLMDKGAWQATVHGVAELNVTECAHTHTPYMPTIYIYIYMQHI